MTTAIGSTPAHTLIAALRARAEAIRREELSRLEGRWDGLCPDDRRRLEVLTHSIVEALLREPTDRLRAEALAGGVDVESARFLFALERLDDEAA